MIPVLVAVAVAIGSGILLGEIAASSSGDSSKPGSSSSEGVLLPAFPNLLKLTPADRQAYIDACLAMGIEPYEMAKVIQSESTWRTDVPTKAEGTPRAGFFQLTKGAHLGPEFDTDEEIWDFRNKSFQEQVKEGFIPYYTAIQAAHHYPPDAKAIEWYKGIFLPAESNKPHDFKIAELGNMEKIAGGPTRDLVYRKNPGFDPGGNKGYFTWDDVERHVEAVLSAAKGKLVDVAGNLYDAKTRQPLPSGDVGAVLTVAAALAPALHILLSQINAAWPNRSKINDDTLPLEAGQEETDHGRGIALDIGHDLKNGPGLGKLAERLRADPRVDYVIWDNHVSVEGGEWAPYCDVGEEKCNPHRRHLHVSILDTEDARNDTSTWILSALSPSSVNDGAPMSGAASQKRA